MNFKLLGASLLLGATSILGSISPALAGVTGSTKYKWGGTVGSLYVTDITIKRYCANSSCSNTDLKMSVNMTLPTCGSRHYLKGDVHVQYKSPSGKNTGWVKLGNFDSRSRNYEGQSHTFSTYSSSGLKHSGGNVWMKESLTCESLAPLRTDGVDKYDPTRGIFW